MKERCFSFMMDLGLCLGTEKYLKLLKHEAVSSDRKREKERMKRRRERESVMVVVTSGLEI